MRVYEVKGLLKTRFCIETPLGCLEVTGLRLMRTAKTSGLYEECSKCLRGERYTVSTRKTVIVESPYMAKKYMAFIDSAKPEDIRGVIRRVAGTTCGENWTVRLVSVREVDRNIEAEAIIICMGKGKTVDLTLYILDTCLDESGIRLLFDSGLLDKPPISLTDYEVGFYLPRTIVSSYILSIQGRAFEVRIPSYTSAKEEIIPLNIGPAYPFLGGFNIISVSYKHLDSVKRAKAESIMLHLILRKVMNRDNIILLYKMLRSYSLPTQTAIWKLAHVLGSLKTLDVPEAGVHAVVSEMRDSSNTIISRFLVGIIPVSNKLKTGLVDVKVAAHSELSIEEGDHTLSSKSLFYESYPYLYYVADLLDYTLGERKLQLSRVEESKNHAAIELRGEDTSVTILATFSKEYGGVKVSVESSNGKRCHTISYGCGSKSSCASTYLKLLKIVSKYVRREDIDVLTKHKVKTFIKYYERTVPV